MGAAKAPAVSELEQAFEVFNKMSHELDTSYRDLEQKVAGLTGELASARSGRLQELAEKERLANRLSSLVAALPGGVLIVDSSGQIRDVNPEAIGLLGGPLIGENWDAVVARTALLERRQVAAELHLRSGKVISVVSRPLDASGEHVMLVTNITQMHKLQEQLGRKKRLTALGEMGARMAHQVRTPLSCATLYLSELGRRDLSDERRLSVAAKIGERLGHMSSLVDGMLGFVRGSAPVSELVYIVDVLQSFEMTMQPLLERCGASLSVPTVDRTLAIVGDQDEFAGLLCNIAMNAVEVCAGPAHLQVWVGALNADWLQLRIIDNGPGIADDVIERIFDPFFTTRAKGTGLGLAVVEVTIANYGGEVSVQNRAQGGAEFIINLPIAHELLAPAAADEALNEGCVNE